MSSHSPKKRESVGQGFGRVSRWVPQPLTPCTVRARGLGVCLDSRCMRSCVHSVVYPHSLIPPTGLGGSVGPSRCSRPLSRSISTSRPLTISHARPHAAFHWARVVGPSRTVCLQFNSGVLSTGGQSAFRLGRPVPLLPARRVKRTATRRKNTRLYIYSTRKPPDTTLDPHFQPVRGTGPKINNIIFP